MPQWAVCNVTPVSCWGVSLWFAAWSHPRHKQGYTHYTQHMHVVSLPLSLSHTHTDTCTHSSIKSRMNTLERRTGWCSLLLLVVYVLKSKRRPAVNHFFPEGRGGIIQLQDSLVWRTEATTKQLGWWEQRLPLPEQITFWEFFQDRKIFLPFKTTFSYVRSIQLYITLKVTLSIFWDPIFGLVWWETPGETQINSIQS